MNIFRSISIEPVKKEFTLPVGDMKRQTKERPTLWFLLRKRPVDDSFKEVTGAGGSLQREGEDIMYINREPSFVFSTACYLTTRST